MSKKKNNSLGSHNKTNIRGRGKSSDVVKGQIFVGKRVAILKSENANQKEISIRKKHLWNALHLDTVEVTLYSSGKNKLFGTVTKVISRSKKEIKGRIEHDGEYYFFSPDSDNYLFDFWIPDDKIKNAKDGDECFARVVDWESVEKNPEAEVVRVLVELEPNASKMDYIMSEFALQLNFPKIVDSEANELNAPTKNTDFSGRIDLREEAVITIDPDDAKDFDDALSLKHLENGNLQLGVHIADVSHYITENSELDIEARLRGNSTYLADRVISMLPEKLSNGVCSLRPDEIRFTMSAFIEFGPRGGVLNYEIKESVIKSARRFTYDEALEIIESGEGDYSDLLQDLYKLSRMLRKTRFARGGINFETSETRFKFDEDNNPVEVYRKHANIATQLVEECMLAANKVVASHFNKLTKKYHIGNPLPAIYRIHENPDPKLIAEAVEFVSSLGKKFPHRNVKSKDLNNIINYFHGKAESDLVNMVLIRSLPKAYYADKNYGHFGLGFDDYTHFTSPIRRYADLVIHRLLKEYGNEKPDFSRIKYLKAFVVSVSKHISETERAAMTAERASRKLSSAMIMQSKVGLEFVGTITGVLSYGIFVMVDDFWAEGLVRIKDVSGDYYNFDEKNYRFVGQRTKKILRIGSRLKVKLTRVNIEKRMIDFDYIATVEG